MKKEKGYMGYEKEMSKDWQFSPKLSLEESLAIDKPYAKGNLTVPVIRKEKNDKR